MRLIVLLLLCLGIQVSYAQNSCATAVAITPGTYTVPVIDGVNIPVATCSNAALAEWYVYTPTEDHSVTVTSDLIANVCRDTHFMVYTGTCAGLICYASDDDSGTIPCSPGNGNTFLSKKTFDALAGTTYYIVWDNKWETTGFQFQLIEAPLIPSPCVTAIPVAAGITTVAAVDGANQNTMCSNATAAEWYKYTPTANYRVTVSSDLPANLCKDTYFSVYTGSCSGTLSCVTSDDNSGVLACGTDGTSNLSKKTFDAMAGTTYYIVWDNKWSAAGFDFELTETVIVIPVQYNTVSLATATAAYNMCMTDMNGDGKDDVAGVSQNSLQVHYQGTDGALTVTDIPVAGSSLMPNWSMAAGDYNRDGYTDLLLGNGSGVTFWRSNETGTAYFSTTPGQFIFCQRTNFADLNNDGNLDAFSCHDIAPNCYYLNDGAGNLSSFYQVGVTGGSMALGGITGNYASIFADYDNDGDVDMFVSKCSGPPCELHRNDGNGVYTDVTAQAGLNITPIDSWSSAIADFDNDGDMDILIGSNGSVDTILFRNNLDTSNSVEEPFTDITVGSGWENTQSARDYVAYDFDNDGFVDVLSSSNKIMFGKGDGYFELINYPSNGMSMGAVGDLNGDGFLDILRPNPTFNGPPVVSYAIPNANKWAVITLKGIQSNIQGIGARVEIYGSWGKQIRDIRSGEGFGYMGTLNAHFGLGSATAIEKIVIKWPSGTIDTINNPTVNTHLTVVEGSTLLATAAFDSNAFAIYPNPTHDVLNIQPGTHQAAFKNAEVFDLAGRLVLKTEITDSVVSVKKLLAGTYILLLRDANGKQHTQKFLKK